VTDNQLQIVRSVDADDPRVTVLAVSGDLDLATSEQLERSISDAAGSRPSEIVLDLRQVNFMDSSGLRAIVASGEELGGSGTRVCIDGLSGAAQRLLEVTGLIEHLRR
jgi:anti-anti-sigma factor